MKAIEVGGPETADQAIDRRRALRAGQRLPSPRHRRSGYHGHRRGRPRPRLGRQRPHRGSGRRRRSGHPGGRLESGKRRRTRSGTCGRRGSIRLPGRTPRTDSRRKDPGPGARIRAGGPARRGRAGAVEAVRCRPAPSISSPLAAPSSITSTASRCCQQRDTGVLVLDRQSGPGGVEGNVAAAAARLGLRVGSSPGLAADAAGTMVLDDFRQRGVDVLPRPGWRRERRPTHWSSWMGMATAAWSPVAMACGV